MAGSSATMGSGELPAGMWFYSFMFDEKHMLPGRVESGMLPAPSSLLVGLVVGTALTAVRFALDVAVFKPLARLVLGFPRRRLAGIAPALDSLCSKSKILSAEEIAGVSASTGMSPEEVKDYAKARRLVSLEDKKINKFKEAAWRLVVYLALVLYGFQLCYSKDWFKDPELVWEGWPLGNQADGLEAYYHVAMGVYWHLIIFQFWDTRRSDFWQMLVHHLATLFLLTYSWLMSLVRIGTLIMLCHDVSDIFMESAKLFNYAQKRFPWCHLAADGIFMVFAAVFGVSRLYVFPKFLVLSVWRTAALSEVSRLFFCGLLCTLLVLHVFWFYLIMRMVYMFVFHGVEEDIRSDNEEEMPPAAATATNGHNGRNGHNGNNGHNGHGGKAVGNGNSPAYDGGEVRANGRKSKTT